MACMAGERDLMSEIDRLDRLARDEAGVWSTDRARPSESSDIGDQRPSGAARVAWIRNLQPSVRPVRTIALVRV
jgi:hypothetical protein